MNKIIITGDVLRYLNGQSYNTPWLYPIFQYLIGMYSNIEIEKFHGKISENFVKEYYKAHNIQKQDSKSWIEIYTKDNNKESLDVIFKYFKDSFVIAFELQPILQKGFDELNIPYIKLMNHPIRYMDDIFFGITSSEKNIFDKIKKYETSEQYYYKYAMILKAEAGVNEFVEKTIIPNDTAVFFAQTNMDCSLLNDNQMVSFWDYKDRFLKICESYKNVYYKIHPLERNKDIINFVKSIPNVQILYTNDLNVYDILSSEKVKKCFSISSGALYEAKYFGKEIEYFLGQPFKFVNDYKNGEDFDYKNTFIPVYKTFWCIDFWGDILSEYIPVEKQYSDTTNEHFSNKMRRILGLTWGYRDFDSVYVKNKFGEFFNVVEKFHNPRKRIAKILTCFIPNKTLRRKLRNKLVEI